MLALFFLIPALSIDTRPAAPRNPIPSRQVTACDLATRSEVEEAVGRAVGSGTEEIQRMLSTCDYAGGGGMISISLQPLAATPDLAAEMASLKREVPEGSERAAAGFADGSFFFDIPGAGTQLHVLIGGRRHLMVSVLGFGEARQASKAAERIARRAMERLEAGAASSPAIR